MSQRSEGPEKKARRKRKNVTGESDDPYNSPFRRTKKEKKKVGARRLEEPIKYLFHLRV